MAQHVSFLSPSIVFHNLSVVFRTTNITNGSIEPIPSNRYETWTPKNKFLLPNDICTYVANSLVIYILKDIKSQLSTLNQIFNTFDQIFNMHLFWCALWHWKQIKWRLNSSIWVVINLELQNATYTAHTVLSLTARKLGSNFR